MNAKEFKERILEILEPIDSALFQAIRAQAASDSDIAAVEASTGIQLPDYIRGFVNSEGNCNGLATFAREEVWPAPKEFEIGPAWTFYRGVTLLGVPVSDLPDWASIPCAYEQLVDFGVSDILPLIKVWGDGGRLWGVNASGSTVLVLDGEVTVLDVAISDVYAEQITELAQRQKNMAERLAN